MIHWSIDLLNAEIGNGRHGPPTLEKYRVAPRPYSWLTKFRLTGW
jgi:hypothetical protein